MRATEEFTRGFESVRELTLEITLRMQYSASRS